MHIGVSTSVIQRGHTGIAHYLFGLLTALRDHAGPHQFTLFVLADDLPLFAFLPAHFRRVVVPERFRPPCRDILWHQRTLPRLARKLALNVLHVPSYRRLLWARPCPLVATIHDLAPFHVTKKYDWKRMWYGRVVAPLLARRQEAVIAVSDYTARDVRRFFGVPPQRITVIPNGLDHGRFHPGSPLRARELAAQRYGLIRPFFLYLARLEHPGKNHVRLLAAVEAFKTATGSDWLLALAGSDWHGAEVIHAAIRQSRVRADIRCLGFVPDADAPDLYRAAAAFVYPSLHEGFGMPPTEAMACGCPVIASTRGALAEVVGTAAALVDPEDTASISRQLLRVASDPAARTALRAAGLEHAQRFNWHDTAAKTLQVYERAARAHPPVRAANLEIEAPRGTRNTPSAAT